MKRLFLSVTLLVMCFSLWGSVTTAVLPADSKGSQRWMMENQHIKAVFCSRGGTLQALVDKKNGGELTGPEGAFRDQFGAANKGFIREEYQGKFIRQGKAVILELESPAGSGQNRFTKLKKRYILREGESKLSVEVLITNQAESMQERIYEYWSNSFFGIAGKTNYFFLPREKGVMKTPWGNNLFYKDPVRGWLAFIGGRSGIVLLPEYKKFNLCFSWNCLGAVKRNTLEFRQVKEALPAGKTLTIRFEAGVLRDIDHIHGAGSAGYGRLELKQGRMTAYLQGFANRRIKARLKVDGKEIAVSTTELKNDRCTTVKFSQILKGKGAVLEITDLKGKFLFDLLLPLAPDASFAPREKRMEPPRDKDPWQYDPQLSFVTPHYKWLNNKKFSVLFLTESTGARDIVELRQRLNFDFKAPTLFPSGWTRAWRTAPPFAPASGGESGVGFVAPYLKQHHHVIVIGDGKTRVRINRKARRVSSWSAYPEKVRKNILAKVRNGCGLLLINPNDPDPEMERLLKSLKKAPAFLQNSMSYSAAPYFSRAQIRTGNFGKGRVMAVTFSTNAYLAPFLRHRGSGFQKLTSRHRFQEYQFAILARMINYLKGGEPVILSLKYKKSGQVEIKTAAAGKYEFELFNAFSQSYGRFTLPLKKGVQIIGLPQLQHGENYLHLRLPGRDFGFLAFKNVRPDHILGVDMKNSFKKGEKVSGAIRLSAGAENMIPELEIIDNTGRLLWQGRGKSFQWDQSGAVVNRHIVKVTLRSKGKVTDIMEKEFFLPEVFDLRKNYSNLLWVGADMYPEYSYTFHFEQLRKFGFNFLYGGMFGDGTPILLKYANVEIGMNWYAGGRGYHQSYPHIQNTLKQWYKTRDKRYIIRKPCFNAPGFKAGLDARTVRFKPFCTRYLFQLGDEMSMTHFQTPVDYCFCSHCLKGFRKYLRDSGMTLQKVNALWKTTYKNWDEVMPQTYNDTLIQPNPGAFTAHRLYMDKVFAGSLKRIAEPIRKEFPEAMVGPTGVLNIPHTYGGNWNFWNMSKFDCASMYGRGRIPVSFNREKRFVMSYYGYSAPEGELRYSLWEGLFVGERNSNHWFSPIFLLPDLSPSPVRAYYSKLLWQLRSGPGDLLFHARKFNGQAAILLSQRSVISNFIKQVKAPLAPKLYSFAHLLEDLGIGYRFVAQEELSQKLLDSFKVLVLCEASALSDKDIAMIKAFVRKGGKVIADYDAALQDEHCIPRKEPALNELFGISTGRQVLRKVRSHTLKGVSIRQAVTGVRCTTGRALGSAVTRRGNALLAIVNGNCLYLNFEPNYAASRETALRDLIGIFLKQKVPARFTAKEPVMHSVFTNGRTSHIALLPYASFPGWEAAGPEKAGRFPVKGKLLLDKKGFLYDSLKGKFLGYGKEFGLTAHQGLPTLLTVLPYKVTSLEVAAPASVKAGTVLSLPCRVKITGKGRAENHVLLFRAFRPDGSESLTFRSIRLAPDGKYTFRFAPALNEKGKWQLTVKDAATGVSRSFNVTVKQ